MKTQLQNNPARGSAATDAEQTPQQKAPSANQRAPEARALPVVTFNRHAADAERKKALQQMQDWGIPVAAGRQ